MRYDTDVLFIREGLIYNPDTEQEEKTNFRADHLFANVTDLGTEGHGKDKKSRMALRLPRPCSFDNWDYVRVRENKKYALESKKQYGNKITYIVEEIKK